MMDQALSGGLPKPTIAVDAAIHVPVEILANLIYLTNHFADDAEKVRLLMGSAEEQIAALANFLRAAKYS